MAESAVTSGVSKSEKTYKDSGNSAMKPARNRKVYTHEMTGAEKFALQACLKAKNALSAIAEHIQEGKGCKTEIVKSALAIQSAAAEVLFAE